MPMRFLNFCFLIVSDKIEYFTYYYGIMLDIKFSLRINKVRELGK